MSWDIDEWAYEQPDGSVIQPGYLDENFLPLSENFPHSIQISGWGSQGRSTCGNVVGGWWCGSEWKLIRESCGKQSCPICFRRWAAAVANIVAGNIVGMYNTGFVGHLYHCVVSPDKDVDMTSYELSKIVRLMVDTLHFKPTEVGYLAFYHPTRMRCIDCKAPMKDRPGRGRAPHDPCGCKGTSGYENYPSLHVHLITNFYVKDFNRLRRFELDYHVKFANISQDMRKKGKPGRIMDREELQSIIAYELGHAEYQEHKHSYTYNGLFNTRRWSRLKTSGFHEELVMGSNGRPFAKSRGHAEGFKFVPERDPSGKPIIDRQIVRRWIEGDIESKMVETPEAILLVRKVWAPVLRLKIDRAGEIIHYPPDGKEWVDLDPVADVKIERINMGETEEEYLERADSVFEQMWVEKMEKRSKVNREAFLARHA